MSPPPFRGHQRQRGVRAVEEAEQVHLDHPAPLVGVWSATGPSSITPALFTRMWRPPSSSCAAWTKPRGLLLVGDVHLAHERRPVEALRDAPEPVRAAGAQRDARARLRQGARGRLSDSRGGACHDRHSAFEGARHGPGMLPRYAPRA